MRRFLSVILCAAMLAGISDAFEPLHAAEDCSISCTDAEHTDCSEDIGIDVFENEYAEQNTNDAESTGEITANAVTIPSEEEFVQKINELKIEYPNGKYWSSKNGVVSSGTYKNTSKAGNTKCSSSTAFCKWCGTFALDGNAIAYQCHGFALLLGHKIFGSNANKWSLSTDENTTLYAGDVVRIDVNGNGKDDNEYDHTIFITKVTPTAITYADCNYSGPCQIAWDKTMNLSVLQGKFLKVWHLANNTLKGSGTSAHSLTVKYNSNGASIDCKRYIVSTGVGLILRGTASTAGENLGVIPDGVQITVSETKISGGYTWGKTTYNSKSGWCALAKGTETYAYKRYYLDSNNVYLTKGKSVFTQTLTQAIAEDLYNYTTFGLVKEGYSFVGWCANADGSSTIFDQDDETLRPEEIVPDVKIKDCTVTLYAIWIANAKTIDSISIVNKPVKMSYYVGDKFDAAGLSVKVSYSDGSVQTVSQGLDFDYDFSSSGVTSVNIGYQGVFTSLDVNVEIPFVTFDDNITIAIGETAKINATTAPAGQDISFFSYDLGIATVDAQGIVLGIANGTTEIGLAFVYNGYVYSGVCTVNVNAVDSNDAPKYMLDSVAGAAGQTVELYLSIENNPGIVSLRNTVSYDTSSIELVAVEDTGLLKGFTTPSATITSPYTLRWADSLAKSNNTSNGNIIKLTFLIKETAETGTYEIAVNAVEARNVNGAKISFLSTTATVTVVDYIKGDSDGDGEVSDWDAIILNRYLAGWDVEINLFAADIDGDGEVSDWDAIILERYLAGWNVELN